VLTPLISGGKTEPQTLVLPAANETSQRRSLDLG